MSQSLGKALHLLRCLGTVPEGLGVRELARLAGMKPSTVHGLLKALEKQGFVACDPVIRTYCLGVAVATLGAVVDRGERIAAAAQPHIDRLFVELGETTVALAWINRGAVVVAKHQSEHQLVTAMPDGTLKRPHVWASGKVLLAHQSEDVLDAYIAERPSDFTKRGSEKELRSELELVRRRGYAEAFNFQNSGVGAYGAPVLDAIGQVRLAFAISAPLVRLPESRRISSLNALLAASANCSLSLGSPQPVHTTEAKP